MRNFALALAAFLGCVSVSTAAVRRFDFDSLAHRSFLNSTLSSRCKSRTHRSPFRPRPLRLPSLAPRDRASLPAAPFSSSTAQVIAESRIDSMFHWQWFSHYLLFARLQVRLAPSLGKLARTTSSFRPWVLVSTFAGLICHRGRWSMLSCRQSMSHWP